VYVTACDLEKSFIFQRALETESHNVKAILMQTVWGDERRGVRGRGIYEMRRRRELVEITREQSNRQTCDR